MNLELIQLLFAEEKRDSAIRLRDSVMNSLRLFDRDPQDIRFRRQLTHEYWKLLQFIIQRRIPTDEESDISFSPEEHLVIDHAFLSENLIKDEFFHTPHLQTIPLEGSISCRVPITVHSLSSFFKSQYRFFMECRGHDRMRHRLDSLRESIAREKMSLLLLQAERERLLNGTINDRERRVTLAEINRHQETLLTDLIPLRLNMGRAQIKTDDQRQAILTLENRLEALNKERRNIYSFLHLTGGALGIRISSMDRLWEEGFNRIMELQVEESRASQDFFTIVQETTLVSPEKKTAFLEEWLKAIQSMSRVMAKRAQLEAEPWLTSSYPADLLSQMTDYLRMAESQDKDLFNNCRTRFANPPQMILLPMLGQGFYDSRGNNLFIPLHSSQTPLASLFLALGQYRWLMDDTNRIRTSYRNLPGHAILAPSQLEDRFIQQYFQFISAAPGEIPIPADVEQWFQDFLCRKETAANQHKGQSAVQPDATELNNQFDYQIQEIIEAIDHETSFEDIEQHLVIRRSLEREGCIDILLCNLTPDSPELERLLAILNKLAENSRFRNLDL